MLIVPVNAWPDFGVAACPATEAVVTAVRQPMTNAPSKRFTELSPLVDNTRAPGQPVAGACSSHTPSRVAP
jgi:hypothetical protein